MPPAAISPFQSPLLDPKRSPAPNAFVESFGAFSLCQPLSVRPAEAAPARVRAWSEISDPRQIRDICIQKVPGWSKLEEGKIAVDQICEGLTNQLFKVHLDNDTPSVIPCVLFRIYGTDVGVLIDQEKEINTFKTLSAYQIAPKMYANGDGWRIEEWHFAIPLKTRHMCNPSILTQVASELGRFHKLGLRTDFPHDIQGMPSASIQRVDNWSRACENAAQQMRTDPDTTPELLRSLMQLNIPEMFAEREWLKSFVVEDDPHIRGSGLDVVSSHCDLQENNILQTQYGLRFIDFEYSGMDYQAFDIANYFCECTLDYVCDKFPFYRLSLSDYPSEWDQQLFCAIYLSEYLESKVRLDGLAVKRLIARVKRFTLMSHYVWAVWAVVRAQSSGMTFNDFDFVGYAQARWDSYRRWKEYLLASKEKGICTPAASKPDLVSTDVFVQQAPEFENVHVEDERPRKTPYILGGALTGGGVLVGVLAVVTGMKLLKR